MMKQRGLTTIDILLLTLVLILLVYTAFSLQKAYQAHYRFDCYENQIQFEDVLWKINLENKREIWSVAYAYTISYPDDRPPVLVVQYQPRLGEREREIQVHPLGKSGALPSLVCPLDHTTSTQPKINYWFNWGYWHCLYNQYHSQ